MFKSYKAESSYQFSNITDAIEICYSITIADDDFEETFDCEFGDSIAIIHNLIKIYSSRNLTEMKIMYNHKKTKS